MKPFQAENGYNGITLEGADELDTLRWGMVVLQFGLNIGKNQGTEVAVARTILQGLATRLKSQQEVYASQSIADTPNSAVEFTVHDPYELLLVRDSLRAMVTYKPNEPQTPLARAMMTEYELIQPDAISSEVYPFPS